VSGADFTDLTLVDVSRRFGRRRALARVDLTCRAGEIVGVFGPNGAGKSTLIGICSTLVRPTSGEVRYGGDPAPAGEALRARIGLLGHDLFLYGDLTAFENLEFFGRLHRLPDPGARAMAALNRAGLADRAGDRVSGFSRGMRQRLAFERAVLHGPRLVLLDEPFTGLDDQSTTRLADRLRALRDDGAIVVMATHDFDSADGLVDGAVCLAGGRLLPVPPGKGSLRARYRSALEGAGS
jgi:heme exporter protein A